MIIQEPLSSKLVSLTSNLKDGGQDKMKQESRLQHYKQLDSFRAIAILLVILQHWTNTTFNDLFFPGILGVNFFFVISGFLITKILIGNKLFVEQKKTTNSKALRLFFIRRSLRIFPLYYATIAFLLYFNIGYARDYTPYYLTYTTNFFNFFEERWVAFGHLWSLCVEEQFYLLWPWVILWTPRKWLFQVIIFSILVGPLFRTIMSFTNNSFVFALPFSSFDGFGIGALLALFYSKYNTNIKAINRRLFKILGLIGGSIILMKAINVFYSASVNPVIEFLYFPSIMCTGCFLVVKFTEGFSGIWRSVFENPILLFIGKISYSLYLFHNMLEETIGFRGYSDVLPFEGYFKILYFIILIGLSTASWYLFEKPILALKRKFEY